MSERRIKISPNNSQRSNISRNLQRSFTERENNFLRIDNQIVGQRVYKLNRLSNYSRKNSIEQDDQICNNVIQQEQIQKDPKKSIDSFQTDKNVDQKNDEEENNIWKKLDELLKRIKFKKYIRTFLSLSRLRLYRLLTPIQLVQINDIGSWDNSNKFKQEKDVKQKQKQTILSNSHIVQYFKRIKIPIFLPHNLILNFWELLKLICIIICYFCYLVAFTYDQALNVLFSFELLICCQICLIIDVFVNINTGIYIKGVLCTDRRKLFNYYKSSKGFYYDIIFILFTTSYFLVQINKVENHSYLLLPILFKLNDFEIITKKIKQKFLFDRQAQNIIELFSLLKNILLIAHIFACIWLKIGLISENIYSNQNSKIDDKFSQQSESSPHTWIELMKLENETWFFQYLNAYYYIIVTMSTVGYGDIRPTNPLEVGISVILVLICSVMFGFTLNSIGEIVEDFYSQEKLVQEKRYIIANYMSKNQIDPITKKSIFEYLEYYWKESNDENSIEENKIIQQLSDNLREELLIQSNNLILKESKVLKENFSPELLAKCIPIIHEIKLTPGEFIIDERDGNLDCSIYFVLFGELEVFHGCCNKKKNNLDKVFGMITTLKRGDSFGERSFFTGETKSLNIRSNNFSKILKIKRDDFIKLLQSEKVEYEKYQYLNDRIKFSSDQSYLHVKCKSCQSYMHEIQICPSIHYIPRKMKIFGVNNISSPHLFRSRFNKRRLIKNTNTREKLFLNTQQFLDFFENYYEELLSYEDQYLSYHNFKQQKTYQQYSEDEIDLAATKSLFEIQKLNKQTDLTESPFLGGKKKFTKKIATNTQTTQFNHPTAFHCIYDDPVKDCLPSKQSETFLQQYKVMNSETGFDNDSQSTKQQFSVEQNNQFDFGCSSLLLNNNEQQNKPGSGPNIERVIQNLRLERLKKQISKEQGHVQFEFEKSQQQFKADTSSKLNYNKGKEQNMCQYQEASTNQIGNQEQQSFDLFQGKFESMSEYKYYFPKYNYNQLLYSVDKMKISGGGNKSRNTIIYGNQIKDSSIFKKNKNIQQILKDRENGSLRSIPKSKMKLESECNFDKPILSQSNKNKSNYIFNKDYKYENTQVNLSQQIQLEQTNMDDSINQQIQFEYDFQSPPRNEYQIHQVEQNSVRMIKGSNYNFSSLDVSSMNVIMKTSK